MLGCERFLWHCPAAHLLRSRVAPVLRKGYLVSPSRLTLYRSYLGRPYERGVWPVGSRPTVGVNRNLC